MTPSRFAAAAAGTLLIALLGSPSVADVISDWSTAVAPPPPELKEVTVDPATTALLFLDMMKAGCSARAQHGGRVQPRGLERQGDARRRHRPRDQAARRRMVSPGRTGQIPGLHSRAYASASRHQDRYRLRQLLPGRN